jgi:hypothetical protein
MKNKTIDKSELMYEIIYQTDNNVAPYILTLGSVVFKTIKKVNKELYIIEPVEIKDELKDYFLYSEENLCKTFDWLKQNNFIFYSSSMLKYCLTEKTINLLNLS